MRKLLFLLLALILVKTALSESETGINLSENESSSEKFTDLVLSAHIDSIIYLQDPQTALFALEINYKKPCSPKDTVTVAYTISKSNISVKEDSFTKEIGCT